jgi:hypothetical protein
LTSSVLVDYDYLQLFELMKRNESGMRPMPWQGKCLGAKQLGRHMMIYGGLSNQEIHSTSETGKYLNKQQPGGIAGLFPSGNFWGMDFVKRLPMHVGIVGRGGFAGTEETHLIYDELDNLWLINASLDAKRMDYSSFLSVFGSDIIITHDPHENEFYITDGVDTLMLNDNGLSKAPWHPTTVAIAQGALIGVARAESQTPQTVSIVTGIATSKAGVTTQLKWVKVVGLNKAGATGWTIKIDWRTDSKETWTRTSAFTPDDRGMVWVDLPCLEYRIILESTDKDDVTVEDILVLEEVTKHTNLRYLIDASTPSAATE